jgi:Tol biopolymer transport system component
MKKVIAFIGLVFVSSISFGQIQSSEIWLIDLIQTEEKVTAKNEIRVTNNDHYDNQPCFSKDGSMIWYASMPDTAQSDLYSYNLKLKETKQVTNTPESEYQPFPIPFYKDKLSIIRVDADGAQRFYQIDMDGSEPATLIENEDSVAYYCWMNDTTVGMYMLNGVGGALHQYDLIPQQSILIMPNGGFGRCLAKIPESDNLSFVMFNSEKKADLMKFDFVEQTKSLIIEMPEGVEDYAWANDGKIYIGNKGKLFYYDVKSETGIWKEIADFSKTIGNFYRMSISPKGDKIAVVSYKGPRP